MAPVMTIPMASALLSIVPVLFVSYNQEPTTFYYLSMTGFAVFIVVLP
jgi:hypothetical protein